MSEHIFDTNLISDLDLNLIAYKNINKIEIKKYHIVDSKNKIIKHKICNIFAPFGREADYNKFKSSQQRFNICFSQDHINKNNKSYVDLTNLINIYENYFKQFDELKDYQLCSNIINRDKYGVVIRCHLKTIKNNTTTSLKKIISDNNLIETIEIEWIDFDKNEQFNMDYCFDCLWIDESNKKFGISIKVECVYQFIKTK